MITKEMTDKKIADFVERNKPSRFELISYIKGLSDGLDLAIQEVEQDYKKLLDSRNKDI
jgi:hypothetical protein